MLARLCIRFGNFQLNRAVSNGRDNDFSQSNLGSLSMADMRDLVDLPSHPLLLTLSSPPSASKNVWPSTQIPGFTYTRHALSPHLFDRSPADEYINRKMTRSRTRNVANRRERPVVVRTPATRQCCKGCSIDGWSPDNDRPFLLIGNVSGSWARHLPVDVLVRGTPVEKMGEREQVWCT